MSTRSLFPPLVLDHALSLSPRFRSNHRHPQPVTRAALQTPLRPVSAAIIPTSSSPSSSSLLPRLLSIHPHCTAHPARSIDRRCVSTLVPPSVCSLFPVSLFSRCSSCILLRCLFFILSGLSSSLFPAHRSRSASSCISSLPYTSPARILRRNCYLAPSRPRSSYRKMTSSLALLSMRIRRSLAF